MAKKKLKALEDGTVVLKTVKRKLPVVLDEQGIALAGVRLAKLLQNHEEFLLQAKGVKDNLKKQEDAIQVDIDTVAASIRAGEELSEVEVEVRADFERGTAEFVRLDTGGTVEKRTLTDDERQKKMVFEDEAADEAIEKGEVEKIDIAALAGKPIGELTDAEKKALADEANKPEEPKAEEPPPAAA